MQNATFLYTHALWFCFPQNDNFPHKNIGFLYAAPSGVLSPEIRVPFVSKKVKEFTNSLSINELLNKGILKSPLKDAFKVELTEEIINRPKHGFNVPIDLWLKKEWKDIVEATFCENSNLRRHSIISREFTLGSVEEMLKDVEIMHGHTIFSLITLNIWLENEFND